jgi:phosphatidate cytidylyltransferase
VISNPVLSPYFAQTSITVVGLLGGSLLALLIVVRFRLARLRESVLFQRWLVWALIAPIYGLAVLSGEAPTGLLLMLLTFQGLREYAALVGLPASYRTILVTVGLLPVPVALIGLDAFHLLPPLLLIAATLEPLLLPDRENKVRHLAFAALGWGYVAWFLAHLILIDRYVDGGQGILLALGLATAVSDVGAFTVGKLFGRHKLAPTISPNKTWEGFGGNVIGAYLGTALMSFALPGDLRWLLVAVLPPVVAIGAVWGDLLESSIKREFEVKDAGAWLPGFGGLLDRVDSLIIVGPLVFYLLRFVG